MKNSLFFIAKSTMPRCTPSVRAQPPCTQGPITMPL